MGQEKTNSTVRIDMLHGGIFRKLLLFALPLIASGILQQSFNSVDVAVVGQFASSQALAAVGSNGLVISLIINLFPDFVNVSPKNHLQIMGRYVDVVS